MQGKPDKIVIQITDRNIEVNRKTVRDSNKAEMDAYIAELLA